MLILPDDLRRSKRAPYDKTARTIVMAVVLVNVAMWVLILAAISVVLR